jgi:hypothetical protein
MWAPGHRRRRRGPRPANAAGVPALRQSRSRAAHGRRPATRRLRNRARPEAPIGASGRSESLTLPRKEEPVLAAGQLTPAALRASRAAPPQGGALLHPRAKGSLVGRGGAAPYGHRQPRRRRQRRIPARARRQVSARPSPATCLSPNSRRTPTLGARRNEGAPVSAQGGTQPAAGWDAYADVKGGG